MASTPAAENPTTPAPAEGTSATAQQAIYDSYWRANLNTIRIVLAIWAFVSLGMSILFMPFLQNVFLPGFQVNISFWFAHQGAIITFVVLIFVYAFVMDRIDRQHNVEEDKQK